MKIIQSFWAGKNRNLDFSFGWMSPKYNYLSWILSANQLRLYYDDVELFTDQFGYEVLIEGLKLPYSKVHVVLDELNEYDDNLWALAKIKAYSLMNEPFLHVDGDVFIFERFNDELMSKSIITQNIETTTEYYWNMWNGIKPELIFLPKAMSFYDQRIHNKAYNMGIFGGNNLKFISNYSQQSFDFVNKNKESLSKISAYNFNIFFEQVLLYELAQQEGVNVDCYITEDIGDNEYHGFGNFEEVPNDRKYLHLLGFYKNQDFILNKMDIYVQKYYPQYYKNLEQLLKLSPTLSAAFKFSYQKTELPIITSNYLKRIIKKQESSNATEDIYCRNVLSEGMVTQFLDKIKAEEDFYLVRLSNFQVNDDFSQLEVELLYNDCFVINLMSIDYVIFDAIVEPIKYSDFEHLAKEYIDDDFPDEEVQNYLETLWKRISIFISYGIFYPLDCNEFKNITGR